MNIFKTRQIGKRGQLGNLQNIVMTLVFLGIILAVGFYVLQEIRDVMEEESAEGSNSSAYIGVNKTISALLKIPTWLSIIVIVAIIGIILSVLFAVFPTAGGARV